MAKLDFDSSIPIYQQIIDYYKKKILSKELKKGDKILSQREFAEKFCVNPNTVQRAYREMELMGLVETVRGQGTFVSIDEKNLDTMKGEMADMIFKSFINNMRGIGYNLNEVEKLLKEYWQEGGEANDTIEKCD